MIFCFRDIAIFVSPSNQLTTQLLEYNKSRQKELNFPALGDANQTILTWLNIFMNSTEFKNCVDNYSAFSKKTSLLELQKSEIFELRSLLEKK